MNDKGVPDFPAWIGTTAQNWTWDWPHQLYLYGKLEMVTTEKTKRLMIFMPPRHSKSETVTVRYTAWRIFREPGSNIILGCYNQRLANRFSRKIRRLVGNEIALSKERKAADEWETIDGGSLCAVGVGAGVTGYGANLIVIDDPVKNRSEAESKAYRENTWDWFNDDIYTRLEPNAAVILIQTRWHEDDLAGRLINESKNGGEQWEVVSLPAIAGGNAAVPAAVSGASRSRLRAGRPQDSRQDAGVTIDPLGRAPGEALCPDRYDVSALRRIEKKLGSYSFAALYQQNPVPLEGGIFKRAWFSRLVEKAPEDLKWFRGYDLAVSTRTTADHTSSVRCGMDAQGNIYIADGFRARIEYPEQRRYVIERMQEEKDTSHGVESALHGQALVQDILREAKLFRVALRAIRTDTDKVTRSLLWAAKAEAGKVILVRGPWIEDFIEEVCSFPNGAHDDQIDAMSLAFRMMTERKKSSAGF
jgi:predicted phage terminase large subunit-like protein